MSKSRPLILLELDWQCLGWAWPPLLGKGLDVADLTSGNLVVVILELGPVRALGAPSRMRP